MNNTPTPLKVDCRDIPHIGDIFKLLLKTFTKLLKACLFREFFIVLHIEK